MAIESGYLIHYVTSYGTQPSSTTADCFRILTESDLPTLHADGYKFLGWYLSNDYNPSTKLEVGQKLQDHGYTGGNESVITFYAYWVEEDKFLIQKDTLVSIADKIRVLSGTTETMGLDNMKTHIDDANNTISSQSDTITQITEVLNNIGTGGSATQVETCNVEINAYDGDIAYSTVDDFGNVTTVEKQFYSETQNFTIKIIKNSYLIIHFLNANQTHSVSGAISIIKEGKSGSTLSFNNPYIYRVSGDGVITYNFVKGPSDGEK